MKRLKNKIVIESWAAKIPFFKTKLHSPLRFLAPLIWESFNFDDYDLVISSASWFVTKGIITQPETLHICYCHTPPRYLYGLETSIDVNKHWYTKLYAKLVNPFMKKYDYLAAQRVDVFVANSENVKARIKTFYGREAKVIYPPVDLNPKYEMRNTKNKENYYLIVGRVVGAKGMRLAIEAANRLKINLKIAGVSGGYSQEIEELKKMAGSRIEFLGFVPDNELPGLYAGAKAFLALAFDEDFGITPVEAMNCGTPVIAYKGGGYKETVIDGKTGVLFEDYSVKGLVEAIKKLQATSYKLQDIKEQAEKFGLKRFQNEIKEIIDKNYDV